MYIFWQKFKTPLSQKGKTFCGFFIAFLKCAWNLEHPEKVEQYPSLFITEIIASERDVYLKRLKGLASVHHSVINVLTGSKHCWSQNGITIFLFFHDFEINWVGKSLSLVTSEIFRLFVNTLTPANKYSRRNMQIFWQQFKTPLSQKLKTFSQFFIAFLKCAWNLEFSEKKEEYPSLITTEIIASERDV